ncbi:unnamed protein product, partial [Allacma fusca]
RKYLRTNLQVCCHPNLAVMKRKGRNEILRTSYFKY